VPTFTSKRVAVTSQTLRTSLSLGEMRAHIVNQRPVASTRTPGWAAMHDDTAQLGRLGEVGVGHPVVEPAYDDIPERLSARYYFWQYVPQDDAGQESESNWLLDAVDVQISLTSADTYLVLLSSSEDSLISPTTGSVTVSLTTHLQSADSNLSLTSGSTLNFQTPDVFLWLAHKFDEKAQLAPGTFIREVSGVNAEEDRRLARLSTLRGGIDMKRIAFLNAIASGSALGPAVVTISALNTDGHAERVSARIWGDGSFSLMLSKGHFRSLVEADAIRLESVYRFAYRYLPLINDLYSEDEDWKQLDRDWLVISTQVELAEHYQQLAHAHPRWAEYDASH
jgi:hypothetical protein